MQSVVLLFKSLIVSHKVKQSCEAVFLLYKADS